MILKQLWSSLELHPSFILNAAICFQSTLADGICLRPLLSLPRFDSPLKSNLSPNDQLCEVPKKKQRGADIRGGGLQIASHCCSVVFCR